MIKDGLVYVGEAPTVAKYLTSLGDEVFLHEVQKIPASEVKIIYEDEDLVVIDKPAGITSHPAPGENESTIAEIFASKYSGKAQSDRDMVVHRLDKGTSGVMILAKNEKARESLLAQFAARKVAKTYLALVCGKVVPREGVIDMPLARSMIAKNQIAPADEGKDAKTLYKVVRYYKGFSLVSASPKTGRTHQIRVHFAAIGHPICGDERYGSKNTSVGRIFLHAHEISFIHPATCKRVKFVSVLPPELAEVLSKLTIE